MRRRTARLTGRLVLTAALALGLGACSAIERRHGYTPNDATLSLIEVGVDTRETVAQKAGDPVSTGVLPESDFYYVSDLRRTLGPRATEVVDREVVAIRFDGQGRVANVERFGLERGRIVPLSRRVTDTGARGTSFLRQIFGSIGQLRAEDVLED